MLMRDGWSSRGEGAPARDPRLIVLCYHAVSAEWDCDLAVSPRAFEEQVGGLMRRGFVPRTLSDALARPGSERTLVVTFDDAYRSVRREALPILERLGAPGTVFVPTDLADAGGPMTDLIPMPPAWAGPESEMRCMSWEELRQLAAGGWEVGSHSASHPDLTALEPDAIQAELARSRAACEAELQRPCDSLAYPFGAWNESVVEEAARAGYEYAVTLGLRLLAPIGASSVLEVPRDGVYRTTRCWQLRLATSPPVRRMRALGRSRPRSHTPASTSV